MLREVMPGHQVACHRVGNEGQVLYDIGQPSASR
jgi:hypothetical protein